MGNHVSNRSVIMTGLIALSLGVSADASAQAMCFTVADQNVGTNASSDDSLHFIRRDGTGTAYLGATGRSNIEAIAYDADNDILYATDTDNLGTLDLSTGAFSNIGGANTCTTAVGTVNLSDIDSLAIHPITGDLWGVERNGTGVGTGGDTDEYLFRLDVTTGGVVPNTFGAGISCVEVTRSAMSGLEEDVDDIAFSADGTVLYGVFSLSGVGDAIATIDATTGAATKVGDTTIADIEGLGRDIGGAILGSTGLGGASPNSMVSVDTGTGLATLVGSASNLSVGVPGSVDDVTADFESFDCSDITLLGDRVWLDSNGDGVQDMGEAGIAGVTVQLVDPGTMMVIATDVTDANGNYYFPVGDGDYRVVVDSMTLPGGLIQTADADGTGAGSENQSDHTIAALAENRAQDFGYASPSVAIEKATNGADADAAPGPAVLIGSTVSWTYVVTNNGSAALTSINVTDDQGVAVTCPDLSTVGNNDSDLDPGESVTCTGSGAATAGQYENTGSVVAQPVDAGGTPQGGTVSDSDLSHYLGQAASVSLEKSTNGADADAAPGPTIAQGAAVNWTYTVLNTGEAGLNAISVTDDQGVTVTCPALTTVGNNDSILDPTESIVCTGSGTAVVGAYQNTGTVSAQPLNGGGMASGGTVGDSDPSNYFGATGGLTLEKTTNGVDADAAPGASVAVGQTVTWVYTVTNTGNSAVTNINVTDDMEGAICTIAMLAAAASDSCMTTGAAQAGQYTNQGSVSGTDSGGGTVSDSDPSNYFGTTSGLTLEKTTNGADADVAPGPTLTVGATVTWEYTVTNTGNEAITNVQITDDIEGAICTIPSLAAGASDSCMATGTVVAGQYTNMGMASGTESGGGMLSASDPSNYTAPSPASFDLGLTKMLAAGQLAMVMPGSDVSYSIVVTNQGGVDAFNVEVRDSLPVGLSLSANDANGWMASGSVLTNTIATLAIGQSVTLPLVATLDAGFMSGTLNNVAQISAADDDNDPNNTPPSDLDSVPDNDDDMEDDQSQVTITIQGQPTPGPVEVPAFSVWGLALMMGLMGLMAPLLRQRQG